MPQDKRICPECSSKMSFDGTGYNLICDRCGYQKSTGKAKEKRTLAKFKIVRSLTRPSGGRDDGASDRIILQAGIAAFKEGRLHEACDNFEKLLLTTPSRENEAEAWYYLSQIYEDPAEKRECLGEVLALNPAHGYARRDLAILDGRIQEGEIVDPNTFRGNGRRKKQAAAADQMACPNCASPMRFNPEHTVLICDHCHHEELLPDSYDDINRDEQFGQGAFEQDFTAALHTAKGHLKPESMRVLQCQSCGVQFVLSPQTMSVTCPYCMAQYVTEAAETRQLLPPQALIPFSITKDEARKRLRRWFKEHNLIKTDGFRVSHLLGVYLPVWTFDISGDIAWSGQVQEQNSFNNQTEWVTVKGNKYLFFDDYLVPATARRSKVLQKAINGFDLQKLVEYDPRYLADWPAERYKIKLSDAGMGARNQIAKGIRQRPHQVTTADVRNLRLGTSALIVESYKLIFVPVWTAHYLSEGETFDVFISGQNGSIHGERNLRPVQKLFSWLTGK